jgi:dihydrofolate synthase/folylpolyglutamate synthase
MALALFDKHGVEWAAIETGVGGRYDQTRALDVAATALTNVGSDHAHLLGREPWQRALDKAGIARAGVPFFTSDANPANLEIIAATCQDMGAPLTIVGQREVEQLEQRLQQWPQPIPEDSLLNAAYQKWNAALSLAVLQHLFPTLEAEKVLSRFIHAQLIGRFWKVEEGVYADIAHNVEKIRALSGEIDKKFGDMGKILVMGLSGQRVPTEVFAALGKIAKAIIITGASYKGQDPLKVRSDLEPLTGDTPTLVISEPQQALQIAKSMRAVNDIILLTGSTYMIEQVLNPDPYLRYLSATFGWRMKVDTEATGTVQLTLPKPPSPYR